MSTPNSAEGDVDVGLSGILEYRDADGNLLKRVPFTTHLPLDAALDPDDGGDHGLDVSR